MPEGEFIRGLDSDALATPEASIFVSSFYIDAYPVTHRRYRACVDAGACVIANGRYGRLEPEFLDYPVQGIDRTDAVAFCAWDGRRLATAAEWEKAARGPAPRRNRYPWGDTIDCSIVADGQPPCSALSDSVYAADPYDAFPVASASYYGAQMMGFGVPELVEDGGCFDWHSNPDYLVPDPMCTYDATGLSTLSLGGFRYRVRPVYHRRYVHPSLQSRDATAGSAGFRCARDTE